MTRTSSRPGRVRLEKIGSGVFFCPVTASTQDTLREMYRSGAGSGTVLVAGVQTGGRGRRGDRWLSPRGGLWFSVLLCPVLPGSRFGLLRVASRALQATLVDETGLPFGFKMPNDIVIGGRKAAGVILEAEGAAAILGVGLNVNCATGDFPFPAAGLRELAGRRFSRCRLLGLFLARLDLPPEVARGGALVQARTAGHPAIGAPGDLPEAGRGAAGGNGHAGSE